MAKKLRVGDTIRGYRVTKVFGPGMMAISYGAEAPGGESVFLKQYKSPSPSVVWYPKFVDYQEELSSRIQKGKGSNYVVGLIHAFEEIWGGPTYFAVYQYVADGRTLDHILEEEQEIHRRTKVSPTQDPAVWARHVTWAKVFMAGIAALHESKIVHADLKPGNAFMITDRSLGSGYQLKLIDTDFSILADRKAPWHGYQGYVGTDNYRSIEHMTRGAVPVPASDIFTCGLILYELLAGVHPYWQDDQAEYAKRARAYDVKPPRLLGIMPPPAKNAEVSEILHRCLSPDPFARPAATAIRAALSGRGPHSTTGSAPPGGRPRTERTTAGSAPPGTTTARAIATGSKLTSSTIRLVTSGGEFLQISIRTVIGKVVLRRFGAEAAFWDDEQCTLERQMDGQWMVTPVPGTVNETLLNGIPLTTPKGLSEGDVLAAGRSGRGISKLPMTAHVG